MCRISVATSCCAFGPYFAPPERLRDLLAELDAERREDLRAVPADFLRAVDRDAPRLEDDFFAAARLPLLRDVPARDEDDFRAVARLLPPRELEVFFADVRRVEVRELDFFVAM